VAGQGPNRWLGQRNVGKYPKISKRRDMGNRRDFLKKGALAAATAPLLSAGCKPAVTSTYS